MIDDLYDLIGGRQMVWAATEAFYRRVFADTFWAFIMFAAAASPVDSDENNSNRYVVPPRICLSSQRACCPTRGFVQI